MLPKKLRTPLQLFPRGARVVAKTKNLTMKSATNSLSYNRGGVVIGKSVGKAVKRNEIRRVVMDFFRNNGNFMKAGIDGKDFVIFVGAGTTIDKLDISKELKAYGRLF